MQTRSQVDKKKHVMPCGVAQVVESLPNEPKNLSSIRSTRTQNPNKPHTQTFLELSVHRLLSLFFSFGKDSIPVQSWPELSVVVSNPWVLVYHLLVTHIRGQQTFSVNGQIGSTLVSKA
jgi:hypothetical protein